MNDMKKILEQKIRAIIEELQESGVLPLFVVPEIRIERPKDDQFGEYTSNIALVLSKLVKKNPMEIALMLQERLSSEEFEKVEVVRPGHINFYFSHETFVLGLKKILEEKEQFGESETGKSVKVNNEFISANPTGPLSVGNGRGGFYADTLSSVLRKSGFDTTNEYYVNDGGGQVLKLGHSVLKDDEAVYGGEYIDALNQQFTTNNLQLEVKEIGEWAAKIVLEEMIKKTIHEKMLVSFDSFISEKTDIVEKGYVDKAIALLKEKNLTYESEGALWLRTTDFGDDKDRVLVKKDGVKAYFSGDCGYFLYKMERGFTVLILSLGADHHGYLGRLKAAAQALGFQGELHFIISQLVKVVKDGKEVRMSKRAGNVVTIDDLIEAVGYDVARFFFLMYAPETHMNFDLGLAEERSQKNPVFYVQYAHARLCSIFRKAEEEKFIDGESDLNMLVHPKERELIRELLFFPELIETVATDFSVHKLPQYAMKLADKFHSFYNDCKVIDEENRAQSLARLELVRATKIVLAETLGLMGISAPEKM